MVEAKRKVILGEQERQLKPQKPQQPRLPKAPKPAAGGKKSS